MMAIGLGKFAGAQRYHTHAYKLGLEHVVRSVGRKVLESGKLVGGLAILEDANHNTAEVAALPVETMEGQEEELLARAKSWMGRIPVQALDILIVDEIGKVFSGAGMDTKVVNRSGNAEYNPWKTAPIIERVYVRGLNEHSYGNAIGLGMADMVHDRLLEQIDWNATEVNSLTSSVLAVARTPMHYPSDRICLEKLAPTVGKFDPETLTMARIANSLHIADLWLTENLRAEIERDSTLEIVGGPEPFYFDEHGDLPPMHAAVALHAS
jgi:hypothetical protein